MKKKRLQQIQSSVQTIQDSGEVDRSGGLAMKKKNSLKKRLTSAVPAVNMQPAVKKIVDESEQQRKGIRSTAEARKRNVFTKSKMKQSFVGETSLSQSIHIYTKGKPQFTLTDLLQKQNQVAKNKMHRRKFKRVLLTNPTIIDHPEAYTLNQTIEVQPDGMLNAIEERLQNYDKYGNSRSEATSQQISRGNTLPATSIMSDNNSQRMQSKTQVQEYKFLMDHLFGLVDDLKVNGKNLCVGEYTFKNA